MPTCPHTPRIARPGARCLVRLCQPIALLCYYHYNNFYDYHEDACCRCEMSSWSNSCVSLYHAPPVTSFVASTS